MLAGVIYLHELVQSNVCFPAIRLLRAGIRHRGKLVTSSAASQDQGRRHWLGLAWLFVATAGAHPT
jgi:hypothetical protein